MLGSGWLFLLCRRCRLVSPSRSGGASRPDRLGTNCEDSGAARLQRNSWTLLASASTSFSSSTWTIQNSKPNNSEVLDNSVNACNGLPFLHGRIRPELPRFQFGAEDFLPVNLDALLQLDTPVTLYRMRRLMRALGHLPRSMRLPLSTPPTCPSPTFHEQPTESSTAGSTSSDVPPAPVVISTCAGP